jgi:DNA-binding beta-propeller fold protein YncE
MISKCSGLGVGAALVLGLVCLNCGSAGSEDAASGTNKGPGPTNDPNLGSNGSINASGGSGTSLQPGAGLPGGGSSSVAGSTGAGGVPIVIVPPEKELEQSFLAPVVTGKFVFSANPKSGRVAVIDADTYAVRLFNAGFGPTYLAAIPGNAGAIVINDLSHDTTLFHLSGDDVTVDEHSLPVHDDANAWATSPDGRFAIAWTRTEGDQTGDPTAGSQTITVLDLNRSTSKKLSVGFHPTQVVVDEASERAFVVNNDGVSVVTLGDASEVSLLAHVSEDPLENAAARDVSILPDGSFAVVRFQDSTKLRFVDLSQEEGITAYDLGAPIADVDLSHDGKLVVAAVPGIHQVVLVPMPPAADGSNFERITIPNEIASSVALSDASELALLYQNGADNSHLTVLDLRPEMQHALRTVDLKGPVVAAFAAPGAASAIAFQKPITGSTKVGLFSGVPTLQKRSAKVVGADAVPSARAFDEAGKFALVTVGNEKSTKYGVFRVRLDTMQEDFLELASPPATAATGIVEEVGRGFVAQTHPEGRITFINLETAQAHTITGFELAARIVQ